MNQEISTSLLLTKKKDYLLNVKNVDEKITIIKIMIIC